MLLCHWLFVLVPVHMVQTVAYKQSAFASNISHTLNGLLLDYDKNLRPEFGLRPTMIKIDMNIRSMGPISEQDMVYSFDCYFRQTWQDKRLSFLGFKGLETLQLNERMLHHIWKPDTYIYNGRGSYLHNITSPNVLFRIAQDGMILLSMRLTIKARCPMHLQKFPMDKQFCPLIVGSHGYAADDVVFRWKKGPGKSIEWANDLTLSQFDLKDMPQGYDHYMIGSRGNFSMLVVHFELERNMGYFLIQIYVPCSLLVVLSWVSFWINREATSDRIALGITTVLTMVFLGMDNRQDLPRVSYSTALDIYVGICFAFVLATIIQFSGVHYFTKLGSGELHLILESDDDDDEEIMYRGLKYTGGGPRKTNRNGGSPMPGGRRHVYSLIQENGGGMQQKPTAHNSSSATIISEIDTANETNRRQGDVTADSKTINPSSSTGCVVEAAVDDDDDEWTDNCCIRFVNCIKGSAKYKKEKIRRSLKKANSVSKIDRLSRVGFPVAFISFNIIYWVFYLKF